MLQLYVNDHQSQLPRPIKELKAFKKVSLAAEESTVVEWILDKQAFSYFHPQNKKWIVEPGRFSIQVGASSRDIRLSEDITIRRSAL